MKAFDEALKDGYEHITSISDPEQLRKLRQEGIQIDDAGYHSYFFGDNKEFELRLEPIIKENRWLVSLYKNNVLLTEKLPVIGLTEELLNKQ